MGDYGRSMGESRACVEVGWRSSTRSTALGQRNIDITIINIKSNIHFSIRIIIRVAPFISISILTSIVVVSV